MSTQLVFSSQNLGKCLRSCVKVPRSHVMLIAEKKNVREIKVLSLLGALKVKVKVKMKETGCNLYKINSAFN